MADIAELLAPRALTDMQRRRRRIAALMSVSGGASELAPTLAALTAFTWASGATDTTPNFNITTPASSLTGWKVRVESSSGTLYLTYTMLADGAVVISDIASATPVADGSYTFRARLENADSSQIGPWSSAAVTIDTTGPTITSATSTTVAENATLAFTVTTDEAATVVIGGTDAALFELASNPSATSRTLRWASNTTRNYESPADSGANNVYNITLTPTDAYSNVGSAQSFAVTVTAVNEAPTVANALVDQTATDGTPFTYQFASNSFSDPDSGDTLTYSALRTSGAALPAWLTFTAGTRTFSGTPSTGDIGTVSVRVTATDTGSLSVTDDFDIVVSAVGATSAWQLEANTDHWQLEDASGNWILE